MWSYLADRRQVVQTVSGTSDPLTLDSGAAQGSILGPLFFIIFVNDLKWYLANTFSVSYADDSHSIARSRHLDEALEADNEIKQRYEFWLNCNRLILNKDKGKAIIMTLRQQAVIPGSRCMTVLGVTIDSRLTWDAHGEALAARLTRAAFLLRRLSFVVDPFVLRSAYFATFHSIMSYCVLLWGHSSISGRIFGIQRKAVRVVFGLGYRQECQQAFVELRILTLPCLYVYRCLQNVKKNIAEKMIYTLTKVELRNAERQLISGARKCTIYSTSPSETYPHKNSENAFKIISWKRLFTVSVSALTVCVR